jgi:hypothetical protein
VLLSAVLIVVIAVLSVVITPHREGTPDVLPTTVIVELLPPQALTVNTAIAILAFNKTLVLTLLDPIVRNLTFGVIGESAHPALDCLVVGILAHSIGNG